MASRKRLGERLLESGLIAEQQLAEALRAQQVTGEQLGTALMRLGYVREDDLLRVLCEDAAIPFLALDDMRPDPATLQAVPEALARAHTALALKQDDGRLTIALANPFDIAAVTALERATGRAVSVAGAPRVRILALLDQVYRADGTIAVQDAVGGEAVGFSGRGTLITEVVHKVQARDVLPQAAATGGGEAEDEGGTAARVAEEIIQRGIGLGATDIHIEPLDKLVRVRYRLDGLLQDGPSYAKHQQAGIITRIKILSGLNIAESRMPQDGRFRVRADAREVDLRISTFPTLYGEDIVLRILDRGRVALKLERLGMVPEDVKLLRDVLQRPHGLVPVTGPTGCGKTTTLYSALTELNTGDRCILTLEDPIEYELEGVRQSQINTRAGLTFASGLRSMLRHDPNVILVGEMRDPETVQIALSAALTGHMVLTTLHTNAAAGAIPRLLDMGAEPFVLASSLQLVAAQRLMRTLCRECKVEAEVPAQLRERFGLGTGKLYRARGCPACRQTGFRGRIGVFELLPVTEPIAQCINERRSAEEIQKLSPRPTLFQDGLRKVRAGITTLDELLRVTLA